MTSTSNTTGSGDDVLDIKSIKEEDFQIYKEHTSQTIK